MLSNIIMTAEDIQRSLVRIAHEIIEHYLAGEQLLLIGLHTRGVPLARRLAAYIKDVQGLEIPVGALDITSYRDDRVDNNITPVINRTTVPTATDGKSIILVDDVLYTGRSTRAAMDAIIDLGRPGSIQLAVLVDRGHRQLPIRANYVGKNIPSSQYEEIQVKLRETDGIDQVAIIDRAEVTTGQRSI